MLDIIVYFSIFSVHVIVAHLFITRVVSSRTAASD